MNQSDSLHLRNFHGWKVLGLCTLCQFVSMGFTLYLIGIYIDSLAAALSATAGQIGSVSALFAFFGALLGPFLGYWSDKGKARMIMLAGAACMTIGFLLLSQVNTLWQAALLCVLLLAPGSAMLGSIPTTVMVVQWFARRRGLAIGITAAGISTGGFIMPPVATWLLEHLGWRDSFMVLGGLIGLILLPAVWKLAIHKPADIGQYPDGATEPPPKETAAEDHPSLNVSTLLRMRDFWVISFAVGVLSFFGVLIITYLTPYAKETGMSGQTGALMLSLYSISGIAGKFSLGWICDHLPPRRMLFGTLAMATIGWLPILFVDSVSAFMVTAFCVGFAMGGLIPVWSSLVALNFGTHNFGRVRGIMSVTLIAATILPGPLGGYLYDTSGTYATTFSALWWIMPIGTFISLFVSKPLASNGSNKP